MVALQPAAVLEPIDLAGAFLLQAIGLSIGVLLHFKKRYRQTARNKLKPLVVDPIKRLSTRRLNGSASSLEFGTEPEPAPHSPAGGRGEALAQLARGSEEGQPYAQA